MKRIFGTRRIPLAYVTRPDAATATPPPALAEEQPNSIEHGFLLEESIARATHSHNNFKEDSPLLYGLLEVATRGTMYAPSIQSFAKKRDGRGAYLALRTTEISKYENLMNSTKWNDTGYQPLQWAVVNNFLKKSLNISIRIV